MNLEELFASVIAPVEFDFEGKKFYARRVVSLKDVEPDKHEDESDSQYNERRLTTATIKYACTKDGTLLFTTEAGEKFVKERLPIPMRMAYAAAVVGGINPNVESTETPAASVASE